MSTRTIGQVAELAGLSVRALHHYDEIGLLCPSERAANGYRRYSDADLARLQQVLSYREIGLRLDEIAQALAQPEDRLAVLIRAEQRVRARIARLQEISAGLQQAVEHERSGVEMDDVQRLAAFDGFDPDEVADEAERRWGHTDTYRESARRTSGYGEADWRRYREAEQGIYADLLALRDSGAPADSPGVAALVDQHRDLISEWFYDCTPQAHRGLGQMYTADPRFTENIDRAGAGLAEYLSAAIAARYAG